ncbi:VWA domain-containing protein [Alienimonas sp. DA493]|uniref:vWA domain-containing protein n=1 Tax=Alienimonas sp. DA493 TaxID=3373605 RepID=UPI0037553A19
MVPHAALLLAAFASAVVQEDAAPFAPAELAAPDALHVAVVLDDSGSMMEPMPGSGESKMDVAKAALRETFAALPPDARVGVYVLNGFGAGLEGDSELLPIAQHSADEVAGKLEFVFPGGGTPLGERLAEAADALLAERAARKYGDYRLLVITDGEATDGDRLERAVPAALGTGLTVDVIGVAMAEDHALATQVDRYRRADDPEALREALRGALAESSGDAGAGVGDAGAATDYELIAPLPDGAAAVALQALSNPATETPIADAPPPPPPAESGSSPTLPAAPADAAAGEIKVEGDPFVGGLCCCLLPIFGAVVLGIFLYTLLSGKRNRRRRGW